MFVPVLSRWSAYVRVKSLYPTGQLKLWGSDDGREWHYLVSSQPFLEAQLAGRDFAAYLFALEYLPAYLRLGVTGSHLGRVKVDSFEAFVGKEKRPFLAIRPTGEVLDAEQAIGEDGKAATIIHRGQPEVVDGLVVRVNPTRKPVSPHAGEVLFGTYTSPGDASDRRAEAIAWWDFTVFQEGSGLHECVRKVKLRNPRHRVILRLVTPPESLLLYAFDQRCREAIRTITVDLPIAPIADLVDTVTLSEEEPGNMMRGYYGATLPPQSVYVWRDRFEKEKGEHFTWPSETVNDWLGEKYTFMLNDLYDYIKKRYPKIKVYQWVELRGYGNISGWFEFVRGEDLKMDGYVLEWFDNSWEQLVNLPLGVASARFNYFENYLRNLMERKRLRADQVLGQVWAHDPGARPTLEQIEAERSLGIRYIYFFWPNAGLPQIPETLGGTETERTFALQTWQQFQQYLKRR